MEAATHGGKAGEPRGALANPAQSSRSPPSTTAAVPGSAEINSLKEQNLVGGGAGPWEHPGAAKEQASGSICSVLGPGWGLARGQYTPQSESSLQASAGPSSQECGEDAVREGRA